MANEKTPVVWDDTTSKHRPLGTGEKMGGLDASSILSSDSGNLITTGSDGLAYATGSGIADPAANNLIETSGSGKLLVTADRIAEWLDGHPQDAAALVSSLADGETIVMSGGKLVVDPTTAPKAKLSKISTALRKAGAGLSVDSSTGKLVVDFASMDPAIMRAVVLSMVQQGGGIGVDQNGQLYVDFDSMPTDKFEAMLKSLKMLVPLSANLNLHVDNTNANAGDTIEDGRGTQNKPFRTIQACIDYATGTYSLGTYNVFIYVHYGVYNELVRLRDYATGGGSCVLAAWDPNSKPIIQYTGAAYFHAVEAYNSIWDLRFFKIVNNPYDDGSNPSSSQLFPYLLSTHENGRLIIRGCDCEFECNNTGDNSRLFMIMFTGNISFYPAQKATTIKYHKGTAGTLTILHADGTSISIHGTYDNSFPYQVPCQGDCSVFANAAHNGLIAARGAGTNFITFVAASGATCTGKRHQAVSGSGIGNNRGSDYPGDVEGTAESETYSWYR